jgi:hypothetical protein
MSGASFLTVSWIVWGSVTAVFVLLMIWKSLVGLKEEDVVILDPAEAQRAAAQQLIIAKVERVTLWAKCFGFASLALLLFTGSILVYRGFVAFNGGQTP